MSPRHLRRTSAILLASGVCALLPPAAGADRSPVAPAMQAVAAALEAGRRYLATVQRQDGAICDPRNPLFDTWETVVAATALADSSPDHDEPVLKRALGYLQANENAEGLLCHNRKCRAGYCLETSGEYLLLLARLEGVAKIRPRLSRVLALQQSTGEWQIGNPDVREQADFPSVTAFVLALLEAAELQPRFRSEAWAWLLGRQTSAGDWGQAWEYYGCPAYALWPAMRALAESDSRAARTARKKAEEFIRGHQQPDGSWHFVDPARRRGTSPELQTALMLSALRYADAARNRAAVDRGILFLLSRQQPDGHWNGGDFPIESVSYQKQEHVFATARALSVLAWYRSRTGGKP